MVIGEVGTVLATLLSIDAISRSPPPLLKVTFDRSWLIAPAPKTPPLLTMTLGAADPSAPAALAFRAPPLMITVPFHEVAAADRFMSAPPILVSVRRLP